MVHNQQNVLEYFKGKSIYLITDSDLDGVSAHILGRYYLQPIVKQFYFSITGDRSFALLDQSKLDNSDIVIFVDTSPDKDLYDKIQNQNKQVFIFDHHLSSFTLYNNLIDNFYWTIEKCGSEIFFDELTRFIRPKRIVTQYIELVRTYDLWKEGSLLWKDALGLHNCLFESVNWFSKNLNEDNKFENFIFSQLYKFTNFKEFKFTTGELGQIANAELKIRTATEQARKTLQVRKDYSNNTYLYFECNSKISLVANKILNEYADTDVKYCVCRSMYAFNKEKQKAISIRSLNADIFDCSYVAELHGGGGHSCASGINFTEKNPELYDALVKGSSHLI